MLMDHTLYPIPQFFLFRCLAVGDWGFYQKKSNFVRIPLLSFERETTW